MKNRKKIKRYRMGLYKNYEKSTYEYNISPRTSAIWETLAIARHCNTEDNTGVHEGIRNAACTKDDCNNTAEQLGDCSGRSDNVANNTTMQSSPCTAKTEARNEKDDTINSNNKFNSSDMGCIDDENEINNEESMDNRIMDDCDDNESETRKKAAEDDKDSYTTGSDVDDNYERIEEQTNEEDDITFDDTVLFSDLQFDNTRHNDISRRIFTPI